MLKKQIQIILISSFIFIVLLLVIRPLNENFYNKMYGIDVGAWNMYKYDLVPKYKLSFISQDNVLNLDVKRYIWHSSFASSSHPHYNESAMKIFLDKLSNLKEVKELIKTKNINKITFKMKLTKNKKYWRTVIIEKDLNNE